ncbi:hypothetical protein [Tessaracoccus coleopterorum]|uniref:hypothetical protein n=1 Tax=Tessaracoccus coleopterorum TaxID=2714950 RepID=UPI0038CD3099
MIPADLSDWHAYRAPRGKILVDPERGRIVFPSGQLPRGVTVGYRYGFSADMGGGEYRRTLSEPAGALVYRVRGATPARASRRPSPTPGSGGATTGSPTAATPPGRPSSRWPTAASTRSGSCSTSVRGVRAAACRLRLPARAAAARLPRQRARPVPHLRGGGRPVRARRVPRDGARAAGRGA